MKQGVAITLIIMGSLLIMAPPASDHIHTQQFIRLLDNERITRVTKDSMSTEYRFGCWISGFSMVGLAVLGSRSSKRRDKRGKLGQVGVSP